MLIYWAKTQMTLEGTTHLRRCNQKIPD